MIRRCVLVAICLMLDIRYDACQQGSKSLSCRLFRLSMSGLVFIFSPPEVLVGNPHCCIFLCIFRIGALGCLGRIESFQKVVRRRVPIPFPLTRTVCSADSSTYNSDLPRVRRVCATLRSRCRDRNNLFVFFFCDGCFLCGAFVLLLCMFCRIVPQKPAAIPPE